MSETFTRNVEIQIKLLRDQLARLLTQNLELERQLEELRREKTEVAVEALIASVARTISRAEETLGEHSKDKRLVISELESTFRGVLRMASGSLALRLTSPECPTTAGDFSSFHVKLVHLPSATEVEAPANLAASLERAQVMFGTWERNRSSQVVASIVTGLTQLLASREQWGGQDFLRAVESLAGLLVEFGRTLAHQVPKATLKAYRTSAGEFLVLARRIGRASRVSPGDLQNIAGAMYEIVRLLEPSN